MEKKISEIIDQLCNHDISKVEAKNQLSSLLTLSQLKPNVKDALNASVSAIYFNDKSDYLRYHYSVVFSLSGLKSIDDEDIKRLFIELNPE